jgi:hypothetical protein
VINAMLNKYAELKAIRSLHRIYFYFMKNHFLSLFDSVHRRWTISLFATAVLLIIVSQLVGITDNLTGIALLLGGAIFLFFTFLHPWRKVKNYAILTGVCVGIIVLEWLGIHLLDRLKMTEYISEGIAMIVVFMICLPGILTGIIGTIVCAFIKK